MRTTSYKGRDVHDFLKVKRESLEKYPNFLKSIDDAPLPSEELKPPKSKNEIIE